MTQKSPSRIRKDLEGARVRVERLIDVLRENGGETGWGLGEECAKAAAALNRILKDHEVPADYKVAVIGRFKAGKSAFVNELLGSRLAGEDTSPETAAITTFRSGGNVVAKINLVDHTFWEGLKARYGEDATNPEVRRIAIWSKFREPAAGSETFDLDEIEKDHFGLRGKPLALSLGSSPGDNQRQKQSEFRKQLKRYTSGAKPHHCLVESIEIEAPSPILGEGVSLIDTPGLDDTEQFRVQLTERAVQNVDAVLFLTKSGAAYGQSEKDFLLSLLRKGTVKQLLFVVTQVDHTYEQHLRQARDQDERPESISRRIEFERRRIRGEIERTLDQLGAETGSVSTDRYREQLNCVDIAFTSAANHRDHQLGDTVKFPIAAGDPGGMLAVKDTLFRILSTESRLAATKRAIQEGTNSVINHLLSIIEKRQSVVLNLKNKEVAEQKLETFLAEFRTNNEQFAAVTRDDCKVLQTALANRSETEQLAVDIISLQANEVLNAYAMTDAGRHWRTRRGGNWGFMSELQTRVANRIFPVVATQLTKQTYEFSAFVEKFRAHLQKLSDDATATVNRLEIGDELQIDMGASLSAFLEETLGSLQGLVEGEENKIIALLEEFVDNHVAEKISNARERVAGIWGRGTTHNQTTEVKAFYKEVQSILKEALQHHVKSRFQEYAKHLGALADSLPDRASSQVRAEIERASIDIRTAAETAIVGEKEAFGRAAKSLAQEVSKAMADIAELFADEIAPSPPASPQTYPRSAAGLLAGSASLERREHDIGSATGSPPGSIQARATRCIERFTLRNGEKGWPFSRIFTREYLAGGADTWLIDPFLALRHQRRNLREFVIQLCEVSKLKELHIITRESLDDVSDDRADARFYDELDRFAYQTAGMRISFVLDEDIHDRFFVLDNGFVFKLGRGLDMYKPVAGLASRDPSLRQVRSCEIDVFGPAVH